MGAAVAGRLARDGIAVVVNYARGRDEAETVVGQIEAAGGRAVAVQADIGEPTGVRTLFDAAEQTFGDVDILVKGNAKMIRDFLKHFNQPVQSSSILGPNTASCRLVRPWVCLTLTVRSLRRTMCVSLFSGK